MTTKIRPNYLPLIDSEYHPIKQDRVVVRMDNRLALSLPDREQRMNWTQFKILATLIAEEVATNGQTGGRYRTTAKELITMAGLGAHSWSNEQYVITVLRRIVGKNLLLPKQYDQELGPDTFVILPPISAAFFNAETGEVHLKLNREVLPYINELRDHFTLTPLAELTALPSLYSGRLFMLMNYCKGFAAAEKRTFSIPWLIEYLGINPNQAWEATRKQIKVNHQQIRQHTNWKFDLVFIKSKHDARRVAFVRFDNIKHKESKGKK